MIRHSGSEKDEDQLFRSLGELIVQWNSCEVKLRRLIYKACGGTGDALDILVHSLPNGSLADALEAASQLYDDDLKRHFVQVKELFNRLRAHRNYLVHGPILTGVQDGNAILFVHEISAKGGTIRIHQAGVTQDYQRLILLHLHDLADYLDQLSAIMWDLPNAPPISSLETPLLPERLATSRSNLIGRRLPPGAF